MRARHNIISPAHQSYLLHYLRQPSNIFVFDVIVCIVLIFFFLNSFSWILIFDIFSQLYQKFNWVSNIFLSIGMELEILILWHSRSMVCKNAHKSLQKYHNRIIHEQSGHGLSCERFWTRTSQFKKAIHFLEEEEKEEFLAFQ